MRFIHSLARLMFAGVALLAAASCSDATGPAGPRETLAPTTAAQKATPLPPELLVAVMDADTRLLAALDADARAPMHAALTELNDALDAGDVPGAQRAVAVVRALVSGHQGVHASRNVVGAIAGDTPQLVGADGADLSALALLADAVDTALRTH
jgi:hypothetical protein